MFSVIIVISTLSFQEQFHSLSLSLLVVELPSPTLASLSELKDICTKFYRGRIPTELGYTYSELKTMDDVSICLLPEKKGTVFKHNEYLVESKVICGHCGPGQRRTCKIPN